MADETGTKWFKLRNVEKGKGCLFLPRHGMTAPSAAQIDAAFADGDTDGLRRFVIYDYGPGDRVTMELFSIVSTEEPK